VARKSIAFSGYFFCFEQQGNLLLITVNFFKFVRLSPAVVSSFINYFMEQERASFSRFSSSIKNIVPLKTFHYHLGQKIGIIFTISFSTDRLINVN
jgi:hypothetical protein